MGIPTEFTIEAINAKGTRVPIGGHDFRVILKDSKGNRVDTMMQDNDDGTYLVTYTPPVSGVESVAISLFEKHIKGSVFHVYISPASEHTLCVCARTRPLTSSQLWTHHNARRMALAGREQRSACPHPSPWC